MIRESKGRGFVPVAAALVLWLTAGAPAQASEAPVAITTEGTQSPRVLSLVDAIAIARQHSPALRQAAAHAAAARAGVRAAKAERLPRIEARETAIRTDGPADVFGLELAQERFSFPAFTTSDPNQPDPLNHWSSELEASLPLFTGGKLSNGIAQAGAMARALDQGAIHAERAVELGVTDAYMNLLLAREARGLAAKAVETTATHVEQAQSFFDAGMMVESDLLSARVQLARMRDARIDAGSRVRVAQAGLARALGIALVDSLVLSEVPAVPGDLPRGLDEALRIARDGRADLAAGQSALEGAKAGTRAARGGYLPDLGVRGKLVFSDDVPFGSHGSSYTVAAQARWTLWDWGKTRAEVTRGRSEESAAAGSLDATLQSIDFEVRAAWEELVSSRARRLTAEEAVGAAERALAILEDRFASGAARTTDLLDAETSLYEARVRALEARFAEQRGARSLLFAAGLSPVPEVHS